MTERSPEVKEAAEILGNIYLYLLFFLAGGALTLELIDNAKKRNQ